MEEKVDVEIDEDELYLRLWALRSMIPASDLADVDDVNKNAGHEEKVDDMMKLIQEADDAAETEVEIIAVKAPPDHQDQEKDLREDKDDCDIERYRLDTTASFIQTSGPDSVNSLQQGIDRPVYLNCLVQKLRNSMQKFRENERRQRQQEQYSPSQSPLHEPFSPINSESAAPSPPESGDEFEISSPEESPSSKRMDVALSSPFSSLPDHDPRSDDDGTTTPLPAASDVPLTSRPVDQTTEKSPSVERGCNLDAVPMEITSENEVEIGEIEFFRNQKVINEELFPTSVWGFKEVSEGSQSDAYWKAVTTGQRVRNMKESLGSGRSRKRRRRKRSSRTKDGGTAEKKARREPEVVMIADESDDEDVLRANLLLDMKKKRSANTPKQSALAAESSSSSAAASPAPPPKVLSPAPIPHPASNEPSTSTPVVPSHSVLSTSETVIKDASRVPTSARLSPGSDVPAAKSHIATCKKPSVSVLQPKVQRTRITVPSVNGKPKTKMPPRVDKRTKKEDSKRTTVDNKKRLELSQIMKKKYFPNLFTKIVIPINQPIAPVVLPGSIEELLKEGRREAEMMRTDYKKRTPPPKPVRKFPPNSKFSLRAPEVTFNTASLFSAAQKKCIIEFSDIQHLPLEQQQEYRRLRQIIKMKEAAKKADEAANKENKGESEDDMRKRLIQGMEEKRKTNEVKNVGQKDKVVERSNVAVDIADGENSLSRAVVVSATKAVCEKTPGQVECLKTKRTKNEVRSKNIVRKNNAQSPAKKPPPTRVKRRLPAPEKTPFGADESVNKKDVRRSVAADSKSDNEVKGRKTVISKQRAKPSAGDERRSQLDPEALGSLQALESSVIGKRQDLTSVLFKMSAQISTLKGERDQLNKAQELVADLRKKLAKTMDLVERKEERIMDLNRVVRESHGQVNEQRGAVRLCESECVARGRELLGSDYRLPSDHSATIAKKLESIRSNAELLQSSPAAAGAAARNPCAASSSITPPPPPVISNIPTSSCALAHLKSSNRHAEVDPHVEFCRYELQGKCNDDSCPFQHHSKRV